MQPKRIVKCLNPACDQRLSVPTDRGKIKVTCVRCKTQWIWSPNEGTPEVRELPFRCAITGKRFKVVFGRSDANHKYRVVHVAAEPVLEASADSSPSARPLLTRLREVFLPSKCDSPPDQTVLALESPSNSPSSERSLLIRLREVFLPSKSRNLSGPVSPSQSHAFDANEFDFSGWYCPCCGHSRDVPVYPPFIRCSKCNECICGARIIRVSPDVQTFECHDGCKNIGRIGGQIESFDGASIAGAVPSVTQSDNPTTLKPAAGTPQIPNKTTASPDDPPLLGGKS